MHDDCSDDDDKNEKIEKISNKQIIFYTQQLIESMEQRSHFHEQQNVWLYKNKE